MIPVRANPVALLAFSLLGLTACTATPTTSAPSINYPGLEPAESRYLDVAMLRPDYDLSPYDSVMIAVPELAFRTPDRQQQEFSLSDTQKNALRDMLFAELSEQLDKSSTLTVVEASSSTTLLLSVSMDDIVTTVLPRSAAGSPWFAIGLDAIGGATLKVELRDSQSNELLAVAEDARTTKGVAILQGDGAVTQWEQARKLCSQWARSTRNALDALMSHSR